MQLKAAPGLKCPREENPRTYIDDSEFVEVPDTPYYHRLVDDGSLVKPAPESESAPAAKARKGADR